MDIVDQIDRVRREVADRGATQAVILHRTYDAGIADVWDACTDAERLARWFEPVSGDLRHGGRYKLGHRGVTGTIEHCDAPTRLTVTWEWEGDVSHVGLTLTEAGERTELRLEHVVPDNEHWRTYGPGAVGVGWEGGVLGLALHLDGDPRADPAEMLAFSTTPEGVEYVRRTGAAWGDAHAAAGVDREVADAAARRTVAAYTGAEAEQPG